VPAVRAAGLLLLLAGLVAVGFAVVNGSARLYLVLIFPVVTGSSPLFALGILGVVGGVILLFLAVDQAPSRPAFGRSTPPPSSGASTSGGVVLIGPLPIFFGAWKSSSRRTYRLAVFLGCIFFVAALVLFFVLL
jgi:uncharacterized membrane protein